MARRFRQAAVWTLAAGMAAAAGAAWVDALATHSGPTPVTIVAPASDVRPSAIAGGTTEAARVLERRNPFRFDHLHPARREDEEESPFDAEEPVRNPVVELSLRGVVGDPPRLVLVEGVPGTEGGVLIGWGAEFEGLRIAAVRGDTILLSAAGALRALTLEKVWR